MIPIPLKYDTRYKISFLPLIQQPTTLPLDSRAVVPQNADANTLAGWFKQSLSVSFDDDTQKVEDRRDIRDRGKHQHLC